MKKIEKNVILQMLEHEAEWLKNVMQNPLNCVDPKDEHEEDRKMRHTFWEALQ